MKERGLHAFAAVKGPLFLTSRDPCDANTQLVCNKDHLCVPTDAGRVNVTPADYMEVVATLNPDFFASLSQEVGFNASRKQTTKAVELTLKWLDVCLAEQEALPSKVRYYSATSCRLS
jgi:queuine/archaeosine tRNA-ribosyltransferase